MNEITGEGIPVLIPPDSSRRKHTNTRPGWNGGAYDFMRRVLDTDRGGELYKQRAQLIEPIFGNTVASPALPDAEDQRRGPNGG